MPSSARHYTQPLLKVLNEAQDIAEANGQTVTSLHILLAFFTSRNPAERLLRHRGVTEDRLLEELGVILDEAPSTIHEIVNHAERIATGSGSKEVTCLHVLLGMTRARKSIAFLLLSRVDKITHLRNRALNILTGGMPRWQRMGEEPSSARPGARAEPDTGLLRTPSEILNRPMRPEREPVISWTPPHVDLPKTPSKPVRLPPRKKPQLSSLPARRSTSTRPERRTPSPPIRPRIKRPLMPPEVAPEAPLTRPFEVPSDIQNLARAPKQAERECPSASELTAQLDSAPPKHAVFVRGSEVPRAKSRAAPSERPSRLSDLPSPQLAPAPASDPSSDLASDLASDLSELPFPAAFLPPDPYQLPPRDYPWLTALGRNLTAEAAEGQLDRLVGREKEITQLIEVLGKRRANNPVLLGEAGVGKTAVVEGLAAALLKTDPERRVISLDVGALLVGTHLRGSFSEKLRGLKEEVRRSQGKVIVFFDELHTLIGAGSGDGAMDAAGELKEVLARGSFSCIGATTLDEFKTHIEPDPALCRRFVPVMVNEPSPAEAITMLRRILPPYGRHHDVSYPAETVRLAVDLAVRFIPDRALPDKAIALLDLAGSRAARQGLRVVDPKLVAGLVSERVDIPVERLLVSDQDRILQLGTELGRHVIGHRAALSRIAEVIQRNAAGFRGKRPIGAFLLVGPSGVGKTETAKALAEALFGDRDALIRFDLSEFSESHSVARLVGAPPGYVGYEAGGQLTDQVRQRPGRVVLFDELEKAHREVLQVLLQILDEGRLTDSHGRSVSFSETVLVMTSNLGADLSRSQGIGFSASESAEKALEAGILSRAKAALAPELWGRIEDKLVFGPLSRSELRQILRLLAEGSSSQLLADRGISYRLDPLAVDWLITETGTDSSLGARPLRQALARFVEAPISARILEGRLHAGEDVVVSPRSSGGLIFRAGSQGPSLTQRPARRD